MIDRTKELEQKALEILQAKKDIYFIADLAIELGISRQWYYEKGLDKLDTINKAIEKNKQNIKRGLRNKWFNNDNATTQVALYKLCATEDELNRLNNNMDVNLSAKGLNIVVADEKSKEALEDI